MLRFDTETIRLITLFENFTGTFVKDCVPSKIDNTIYFLVEDGMLKKAIGKNGRNVKEIEEILGKHVKIFELSKDVKDFVKNAIPHIADVSIIDAGKVLKIVVEKGYRPVVIGRDEKNLNVLKEIMERNYGIKNIIVR